MYIYFYTEKQIIVPVDFLVSCVAPLIPELTVQLWYVIVRVGVRDADASVMSLPSISIVFLPVIA